MRWKCCSDPGPAFWLRNATWGSATAREKTLRHGAGLPAGFSHRVAEERQSLGQKSGTDSEIGKLERFVDQWRREKVHPRTESWGPYPAMKYPCRAAKSFRRPSLSKKRRIQTFEACNYRCQICGASAADDGVRLEVDHKQPVCLGGSDAPENLWVLCFDCNRGKAGAPLDILPPAGHPPQILRE